MRFASELAKTQFIPTGTFVDKISGGIAKGKILVISGKWSVGKSTLIMQAIAAAQKEGLRCLIADVEFSYETPYASSLGVDNSKLGIIHSSTAEETLDELEKEIGGGKWDIVVIDSIGGLKSRIEDEKAAGEKTIGVQASLVAKFIRKVVPVIAMNGTALVCLTHESTDIMSGAVIAAGGAKLFYHASQHIRLKSKNGANIIKQGDTIVGKVLVAEMKKDKLGGRERAEAEGQLLYGSGFSASADQFQEELDSGRITKVKNTYMRDGEVLGVGRQKATEALKELLTK